MGGYLQREPVYFVNPVNVTIVIVDPANQRGLGSKEEESQVVYADYPQEKRKAMAPQDFLVSGQVQMLQTLSHQASLALDDYFFGHFFVKVLVSGQLLPLLCTDKVLPNAFEQNIQRSASGTRGRCRPSGSETFLRFAFLIKRFLNKPSILRDFKSRAKISFIHPLLLLKLLILKPVHGLLFFPDVRLSSDWLQFLPKWQTFSQIIIYSRAQEAIVVVPNDCVRKINATQNDGVHCVNVGRVSPTETHLLELGQQLVKLFKNHLDSSK
jgi:hypothetical protein